MAKTRGRFASKSAARRLTERGCGRVAGSHESKRQTASNSAQSRTATKPLRAVGCDFEHR
ncbi:hypothetical protein WI23_01255 [Burkholderia oklahomensis C6786]|nr:hypothetical protein WI23_01255 [Burkholderia oklahomensis C6786]KUY54863.1 hypothetical protein WI23_20980 [Burkholderia oklahomensis C6786]